MTALQERIHSTVDDLLNISQKCFCHAFFNNVSICDVVVNNIYKNGMDGACEYVPKIPAARL